MLVIHGDADATVPSDKSGRIAASMVLGLELLEYPGALHGLFFTEMDCLDQDLLAIIRRQAACRLSRSVKSSRS